MSHEHHQWRIGQDPPLIRPHSLAKHRVLRSYLERYVEVLTKNPRLDQFKLTLIDGFAGGGLYLDSRTKELQSGSPLIMLEAMEKAAVEKQRGKTKDFHLDVKYLFIEKSREALAVLRKTIDDSRFTDLAEEQIQLIQGEFIEHVPAIIDFIKNRGRAGRSIFVLDQFGYSAVPFATIRAILDELENAEVILTFATDSLIDYLSADDMTQQRLDRLGISLPAKAIATAKEHRDWRRTIQFALHQEVLLKTGAKYYTPFFIRSPDAHRDFWLIHLSGHYRARDVMVGLHWKESTSFAHYGGSGLRMLGYDQDLDAEWTNQKMLPGFFFDDTALASSHEELLEQLPKRIFDFGDGVAFDSLFASLTNECPVTADIMKGVVADLAAEGEIYIRDKSGNPRRGKVQQNSDIIIPSRQKRLFTYD